MTAVRSILVDIDAAAPAHPALERAVRLARSCGATLTVSDVITIPGEARRYLQPGMEDELVSRRREQLARAAREIAGIPVRSTLLMGRPATALIQEVLRHGHDLLVRSRARDLVARPKRFGAVDMELLRGCPCPVLAVAPGAPPEKPRVVGAVQASAETAAERALNATIAEWAMSMAAWLGGAPTLLHAWAPFAEGLVRSHASDADFLAYVDAARRQAEEALATLTRPFRDRLSPDQIVLRRGAPEDVIPEYAVSHGADLVVIGTVGRAGVAGLFIGNTAERVLHKLPCSVLAVKPEGFVSPVSADRP
jgi:nucleotide-binding universal stress UspA family protein